MSYIMGFPLNHGCGFQLELSMTLQSDYVISVKRQGYIYLDKGLIAWFGGKKGQSTIERPKSRFNSHCWCKVH